MIKDIQKLTYCIDEMVVPVVVVGCVVVVVIVVDSGVVVEVDVLVVDVPIADDIKKLGMIDILKLVKRF